MLNRRYLIATALTLALGAHARTGAGQIDRGLVDHLDPGFRPVRPHPAAVQAKDRHRREGRLARHRSGARHRPPRRRRCGVRSRQVAGRKIRRRRLRREALSRHVQRLRPDRAEERSGRHQGPRTSSRRSRRSRTSSATFISRGDKSGTHAAELNLWKDAGIDIAKDKGPWYKEIGQGMGAALNTASAPQRLCADRPRHLASFKNRADLAIVVEGDKRLFNQYGVILVNPQKHANVKKDLGQAFIDWLDLGRKARRRSPTTRSTASSCSSRTPPRRARNGANVIRTAFAAAALVDDGTFCVRRDCPAPRRRQSRAAR